LGRRLDERFLDGVEYAERMMSKHGAKMFVKREKHRDGTIIALGHDKNVSKWNCMTIWLDGKNFPELKLEDRAHKVRIILED
jgi:hypothetical protein